MNKKELVDFVKSQENLRRSKVNKIVDLVFQAITQTVDNQGVVTINGFGTFKQKMHKEKTYYSGITREQVTIPAHPVATFKQSKKWGIKTK